MYWNHNHQLWDYCLYLGSYVINNKKFDVGLKLPLNQNLTYGYSLASVFGNNDWDYFSGYNEELEWAINSDLNTFEEIYIGLYEKYCMRNGKERNFYPYRVYHITLVVYNYKLVSKLKVND